MTRRSSIFGRIGGLFRRTTLETIREDLPDGCAPIDLSISLVSAATSMTSMCSITNTVSQMSLQNQLMGAPKRYGSLRSLWRDMPEVMDKGIREDLSQEEELLQELYFEIISTEASYLQRLDFLYGKVYCSPALRTEGPNPLITRTEKKNLFSNISAIKRCNEKLFSDLEARWWVNSRIHDLCDVLAEHLKKNFECYVHYLANQEFQARTFEILKTKPKFAQEIQKIESTEGRTFDINSCLIAPVQRLTKYALMVEQIMNKLPPDDPRQKTAEEARTAARSLTFRANECKRQMERKETMMHLMQRIKFGNGVRPFESADRNYRSLVKLGDLDHFLPRKFIKPSYKARPRHVLVFNGAIMITKELDTAELYCLEHSDKKFVEVVPLERLPHTDEKGYFFAIVFKKPNEHRKFMYFGTESERERMEWTVALRPFRIPEESDVRRVRALYDYHRTENAGMDLRRGDEIIIDRGEAGLGYAVTGGWFPMCYVEEITTVSRKKATPPTFSPRLKVNLHTSTSRLSLAKRIRRLSTGATL